MIERPATEPAAGRALKPERGERGSVPWGAMDVGFAVLLILLAFVPILLTLVVIYRALGVEGDVQADARAATVGLLGQLVLNGAALGISAVFSLRKYKLPLAAWGLVDPPRLRAGMIFLTLFLCYVALATYTAVAQALPFDLFKPESNVPRELFDHAGVVPLAVFFILVIAPLTEEMFFRGFLFQGLASPWGFWPGALVSGLVFASIHGSVSLLAPFVVIGMLLAWIVRRTGSLWNSIAVHFLFNAVSLAGVFLTK
jgi:membrane protease YdiL (CAAX protease family)